jgi:hypothetical protein
MDSADYVSRNLTTHLHDISLQGLRAEYMQPIFPSLTFPYVLAQVSFVSNLNRNSQEPLGLDDWLIRRIPRNRCQCWLHVSNASSLLLIVFFLLEILRSRIKEHISLYESETELECVMVAWRTHLGDR